MPGIQFFSIQYMEPWPKGELRWLTWYESAISAFAYGETLINMHINWRIKISPVILYLEQNVQISSWPKDEIPDREI